MRFYRGITYNFATAVYPLGEYTYEILDVSSDDGKCGYILFGFDREYKVGAASRIIISGRENGRGGKRICRLPFVKNNGRLEFDLPEYLSSKGLKYKLYKRYDLRGGCGSGPVIYCKNGSIAWGSEWCDYTEYSLSVWYDTKPSCMRIDGKGVKALRFMGETHPTDSDVILEWCKHTMEQPQDISYGELGSELDRIGLDKRSSFFSIEFSDGSSVSGKDAAWEYE